MSTKTEILFDEFYMMQVATKTCKIKTGVIAVLSFHF